MGYPMTYNRFVLRNYLLGGYEKGLPNGDLRRLELDTLDDNHLRLYATRAGITEEQARTVLALFLFGEEWDRAMRKAQEEREASVGEDHG